MTGPSMTQSDLDLTGEVCPMTTVHLRLALDRLPPSAILGVRLRGDEPRKNVAAAVKTLGHEIVSDAAIDASVPIYRLVIRKSQASTSASPPSA